MRAIVYARCSTEHQAAQNGGVSIENQVARCKDYADRMGMVIVSTLVDEGISGGLNKGREGFLELLDRAERGEFDAVVFYSLERLSRDMLTCLVLEKLLNETNVSLHTCEGHIDTSTTAGYMSFVMQAFQGEIERRNVKERTRKAMEYKRSQGQVTGNVPYGYARNGKGLVPIPTEQAVIETANELYGEGTRLVDIVSALNDAGERTRSGKPWTPTQVKRLIDGYEGSFTKAKTRISEAARRFIEAIA